MAKPNILSKRQLALLIGGLAEKRAIRLGAQSLAKVEVLEGLKPGERIVTSGTDNFHGAERVAVSP